MLNGKLILFHLLIFWGAFGVHQLSAQDALLQRQVTLDCPNCTPSDALEQLHNTFGIDFSYDGNLFRGCSASNLSAQAQPLEQVLKRMLKQCKHISYKEINNQIVFSPVVDPKVTLRGYIRDKESNESLVGASIQLWQKGKVKYTHANSYGFYSFECTVGKCSLLITYPGYDSTEVTLTLNKDLSKDIWVAPYTPVLRDVEVLGRPPANLSYIDYFGARVLPKPFAEDMPTLMGQHDVFKSAALLPGIQTGVDGLSGLHVRGGNTDQNLVLLDDVPVYIPTHVGGLMSAFNSDLIKHTQIWKGDSPARYSGRIASVVDVRTREGNNLQFHSGASISPILASGYVEGPIKRSKGSFIASFRHSLFGPWINHAQNNPNLLNVSFLTGTSYNVRDLNLKFNFNTGKLGQFAASYYYGNDRLNAPFYKETKVEEQGTLQENYALSSDWGNHVFSVQWRKVWYKGVFSSTTLSKSRFKYSSDLSLNSIFKDLADRTSPVANYTQLFLTDINDTGLRSDVNWEPFSNLTIKCGGAVTYHQFRPGAAAVNLNVPGQTQILIDSLKRAYASNRPLTAQEYESYGEIRWAKSQKWDIRAGVQATGFQIDTARFYAVLPQIKVMHGNLDKGFKQWVSYNHMAQYLHQVGGFNIGLPFELWVPSTTKVRPERARQLAIGLGWANKNWGITLEAYRKKMDRVIVLQSVNATLLTAGAQDATGWEERIASGEGLAKGIELIAERKSGMHRGFVSYTRSRSTRQFDAINMGRVFPYQFDRPHDFKANYSLMIKQWFNCSATWVWMTGNPITLAIVKYKFQTTNSSLGTKEVLYYPEINSYRLPPNHRLDVVANFYFNQKIQSRRVVKHHLQLGVYNLYNRANPFYMVIERSSGMKDRAIFYTLFPILPMFRYDISI